MIVEIKKIAEAETCERFHLLMYLPAAHYMEGMDTLAARVAEADRKREAIHAE